MKSKGRGPSYGSTFLMSLVWFSIAGNALADASGRAGYSGLTANKICSSCHSGTASAPTVRVSGPTTVTANSSNSYTVTVLGGPGVAASVDIAVTSGTLAASGNGTKLLRNEIVQSAPRPMTGGSASFTFTWQAPATSGPVTLYVSGLSTNGNNSDTGDGTAAVIWPISVQNVATTGPTAVIKGPTIGVEGVALMFDGSSSIASAGGVLYDWNFGDNSAGAGAMVSHTFVAGNYTVKLTVTSSTGATHSASSNVRISAANAAPSPVANAGGPYTGSVGTAVVFDGSKSTASAGSLSAYKWTFGDGQTGSGKKLSHTFATAGVFSVGLEVVDSSGVSASTQTRADIAAPAVTVTPSTGETVYDTHCASCHGASGTGGRASGVLGASVADINEAIAEVRTMRSLRGLLSSSDLADIANYLKRNGAGSGSGSNSDSDDDSDEDSSDEADEDSDENSTDHVKGRSRDNAPISGTPGATGVQSNPFSANASRTGGLDGVLLLFVTAWGLVTRARRGKASA